MGKLSFGAPASLSFLKTGRVKISQYRWKFFRLGGFESHPLRHDFSFSPTLGLNVCFDEARIEQMWVLFIARVPVTMWVPPPLPLRAHGLSHNRASPALL